MNTMKHRQVGIVLVTNLIMLLMITLLASAHFKNSFIQVQMSNHHQLATLARLNVQNTLTVAKSKISDMLTNNADLMTASKGYYPLDHQIHIGQLTELSSAQVLQAPPNDRYVIVYLGKSAPLAEFQLSSGPLNDHHLFKIMVMSSSAKGTEYVEQQLYTVVAP